VATPSDRPRPRVTLHLAAAGRSWHVRLGERWVGQRVGQTMGLVYEEGGHWHGRHYVADSSEPSRPAGVAATQAHAVDLVIDGWTATLPPLG
jgi:hypothetical protein